MAPPKRTITRTVTTELGNPAYLRHVRESANVTQSVVANAIGISVPYLSDLERGNRPIRPAMLSQVEQVIERLRAAREGK